MFGKKTNRSTRTRSMTRKAQLESLEHRLLLSVTIAQANGDLFISGDSSNNHVAFLEDGANRLFVYGDASTAITGDGTVSGVIPDTNVGGGREFDAGLFRNIFISMGSGSDTLEFSGLNVNDVDNLTINTGDATGADTVLFGVTTFVGNPDTNFGANALSNAVAITTGNGNDMVTVDSLTVPTLTLNTGTGNDAINIAQNGAVTINGNAVVNAGNGTNSISVGGSGIAAVDGTLSITTGSGNDTISLNNVTGNNAVGLLSGTIQAGAGNNTITVGDATVVRVTNELSIVAGSGADSVHVDALAAGSLSIDAGDGQNTVTTGANGTANISGVTSVLTGSGNDGVRFENFIGEDLRVSTGSGVDAVDFSLSSADSFSGNVVIDTGDATSGSDSVTLGTANNTLTMNGTLSVTMGNGDDVVNMDNVTGLVSAAIDAGGGGNTISFGSLAPVDVTNGLSITTGSLADTVTVDQLTAGSLAIDTGDGGDSVTLGGVGAVDINGLTSIRTGDGVNTVSIDDTTGADLTIQTGGLSDTVTIAGTSNSTFTGNVSIDTGDATDATDEVAIGSAFTSVTIDGTLSVTTGNGDDEVTLDGVTANSSVQINAGSGDNQINLGLDSAVTVGTSLMITSGSGDDDVEADSLTAGTLGIQTGVGDDLISLSGLTVSGDFSVSSGNGNQTLKLSGSGAANVSLDSSEGIVTLSATNVRSAKAPGQGRNGDFRVTKTSHSVTVAFQPKVAGVRNASILVKTRDPQHPAFTLNVQGTSPVQLDLTPEVQAFKVPSGAIVAGRTTLNVAVAVTYNGNVPLPSNALVDIQIFAHDTVNNTDTLLKTLHNQSMVRVTNGKFRRFRTSVKLPNTLAAGNYAIRATVVDVSPFAETNTGNNTATSNQTVNVVTQTV